MLFTGWNFMRWLRLALGLYIGLQAIQFHDTLSGVIAIFLLLQVITNTGCCGISGCAVPASKENQNKIEEIEFEEVKEH